jgi:AAA family ATP:ADP antiporter
LRRIFAAIAVGPGLAVRHRIETPTTSRTNRLPAGALVAAIASTAMIAQQVAGKATRDALFLSSFGVTALPGMMAASAVFSLLAVIWLSRMLMRYTPARVVPVGFALGGAALLGMWAVSFVAPRLATVVLYLYSALFGTAMISAFWSYINETFDPHTSRRSVSAITGGGTLGGLLGGLAAWRASALIDVPTMLPFLAALNLVSCWGTVRLRKSPSETQATKEATAEPDAAPAQGAMRLLRDAPYLRNLALIVALGALTSGLIDYVFNAEASKAFAKGPALLSFFSLFWVIVGVFSFALQFLLGRLALERLGLAVTVALLPAVVVFGGAVGLAVPGLWTTAILRGGEATQRNTLFRAAYEMLYTPISEQKRRALKTLIDVGCDRIGTVVAACVAMVAVAVASRRAEVILLGVAIACAIVTITRSRALHTGYVSGLEESLQNANPIAPAAPTASPLAADKMDVRDNIVERLEVLKEAPVSAPDTVPEIVDASLRAIADLRSGNAERVRRIISTDSALPATLVSFVILLLADKDFHMEAVRALRKSAAKNTGQLIDALCDHDTIFDIRRRIPRVLSECLTQDAADGLVRGIDDDRFEVRYECGRALRKITGADPGVVIAEETVISIVKREVERSKEAWESQTPPELDEDENEPPALVDRLLRDRIDRSLEHVFTVLALHLDRKSLQIAFKALHEKDERLRGTALEYLETVLPDEIRDAVWPFLGEARPMRSARSAIEILADLKQAPDAPPPLVTIATGT